MEIDLKLVLNQCNEKHQKPKYYGCQVGFQALWCDEGCDRKGTAFCTINILKSGEKPVEIRMGKCLKHADIKPALDLVTQAIVNPENIRLGSSVISKLIVICDKHGLLDEVKAGFSKQELDFLSRKGFELN